MIFVKNLREVFVYEDITNKNIFQFLKIYFHVFGTTFEKSGLKQENSRTYAFQEAF